MNEAYHARAVFSLLYIQVETVLFSPETEEITKKKIMMWSKISISAFPDILSF